MAYNFSENLTVQLQLLEPTAANINSIRRQLESGLSGINVGSINTKNFAKANVEVNNLSKSFEKGEEKAKGFFDAVEGKARGFAAYTVASTAILKLTGAVSSATREAIKYEAELLKISQVTGDSVSVTKNLQKSLFDISKQYNVNISKVAQLTRTLTQTGLSFREAAKGAEILARTSLLATFDSLTSTTEGLIAVMQTFNLTVRQGGKVLEQINDVSKAFAVESSDIVEAIRRTGGAFSTAGGQIEELIALFTSVRSTSRESAETIATGFRTIFGRLQRPKTIEYFKQLGIQLQTAEGQFIGPLKAIEEIGKGLERLGIQAGSIKFAEVVEEIGGIRQISRVVPLLEQYRKTQRALDIQNESSVKSYADVKKAQQGLGYQFGQLKQEFTELVAGFVNSESFKVVAKTFIGFTRTIISLTKALQPLMPLLAAFATFKIGRGISQLVSGGVSIKGIKESMGFARGGVVPGSGNRDTVPAMLTPGEFVVRKSAVKAYGADRLAKINKYAQGGSVQKLPDTKGLYDESINVKNVNQQSKLPASAKGSIKGLIFEKFVKTRLGKSGNIATDFPDIQGNSAVRKLLGDSKLDHIELKYEDNKDTRYAYRKGVRDNYARLGYATEKDAFDKIGMVYGFAKGGSVGTDTVPALLTPGEFVVNKKSAQAFGYNNLRKINKYASGGTVDGVEVQRFGDGDVVLSKEEKKRRREQYKSDQLGTSLSRGERTGGWQKEIIAKYSKLIAEEKQLIDSFFKERIKTAIAEKKSVFGLIHEKNRLKQEAEQSLAMGMNKAISDKQTQINIKKANDSLKILDNGAKRSGSEMNTFADNAKKINITLAEVIWNVEGIANTLESYGVVLNRDALEAGKTKAAKFGLGGDIARRFNEQNISKYADTARGGGAALRKLGRSVGGNFGKGLEFAGDNLLKFGSIVSQNAGKLAKFAKFTGRIFDVLGYTELLGGFLDALFSTDYKKVKELAIERGDVESAGIAAAEQYHQEFLRGIPIIGGFLSAFQPLIPEGWLLLDSLGRLNVATARLEASFYAIDKVMKRTNEQFLDASREGDYAGMQAALDQQDEAIGGMLQNANAQTRLINQAIADRGANARDRAFKGAAGGGAAGAAIGASVAGFFSLGIGAPIGAAIGAAIGTIVGGVHGYVSAWNSSQEGILKAYEIQGEAYRKWGEQQASQTQKLGALMTDSALEVLKAGGSIDDAFNHLKIVFGEDRVNKLFSQGTTPAGVRASYKKANEDYQNAQKQVEDAQANLDRAKVEEAAAWSDWLLGSRSQAQQNRAAAEVELERAKASAQVSEADKQAILDFQIRTNQQIAMNKQIEIENRAMRERVMLSREFVKIIDRINLSMYDAQIAMSAANDARSGRMTAGQVLSGANIGVSERTLMMSGQEVLRNDQAYSEMQGAIDRMGGIRISSAMREAKANFDAFGQVEDMLLNNNALGAKISEIRANAKRQAGESLTGDDAQMAGTLIKDELVKAYKEAGITMNAQLEAALLEYGNLIAENMDPAQAMEKVREKLGEEAVKLIEAGQEKFNEYIKMEQEYSSMKIELIQRVADLSMKAYNDEKDYFEQRIALTEKVEDFLNEGPLGKGRAGFLQQRGLQRRSAAFDGLRSARGRANLPDDTSRAEVGFGARIRTFNENANDASETLAKLAADGNMLLSTLQHEIEIEQDYLDSLIEVAKAQQEYTQALNDAQGQLVRDLVTGTDEEQADMLSTLNAAAYAAMQGSFQGIPEDMKKDIFSIFDQFGDVEIPGLGMTGRDAQRQITKNELMMNWGLDEATADQLASKAVKDKVPIDEKMKEMIELQEAKILELLERERQMKQYLQMIDMYNNNIFAKAVQDFRAAIDTFISNLGQGEGGAAVGDMAAGAAEELEKLKARQAEELAQKDAEIEKAKEEKNAAQEKLDDAKGEKERLDQDIQRQKEHIEVQRRNGASDADIAPMTRRLRELENERQAAEQNIRTKDAELTAVDERVRVLEEDRAQMQSRQQDEQDMLIETRQAEIDIQRAEINTNGTSPQTIARGGVVYANDGMLVNYQPKGTDTVPAMLTPGEFVMRKEAVDRIGVANLEKMNRGGIISYKETGGLQEPNYAVAGLQDPGDTILNILDTVGILDSSKAGFFTAALGALDGDPKDIAQVADSIRSGWNSGGPLGPAQLNLPKLNPEEKLAYEKNKASEFKKQFFQGTMLEGHYAKGGRVKYLGEGGSSSGPYRSDANIARFGASDPRFEQYGLRGLDPNSPYYQQALAYWQQVMDFQNKYNARAANMNQMVGNSQMQWMAMMQNMWAQSGYFAKGGKVQGSLSKYGINTTPMLDLNSEENLQMGASLAPLAGGAGAVVGGAAVAAGTGVVGITAAPAAALGIAASLPIAGIAAGIYALDEKGRKYQQEKAARWRKERVETDNKIRGEHYAKKYGLGDGSPLTAEEAVKLSNDMAERNRELDRQQKQRIADSYRQKYPDITDEQIDLFENTKIRRQMYATGKPGEVTDDPSKANMLVPTRVTHADREKGLLTSETVLKDAGPLPESNIEYRNGLAFKKDPNGPGFTDTSFKGFPEKAFVDTAPGQYEQKLIDEQKAIADAQAAADVNAKIIGSSKIPGTVSGVGGMTLDDGTSGSFTNMILSSEPYDPFADTDSKPVTAAPAAKSAAAAAAAVPMEAAAAAAAEMPVTEPTGPSFTPTGNVGVDALMNTPLDIKEGKEKGNQARYRSRLDALRRAGADNNALDEFKSQYRGQVYGAENQQLYDYNKSRLSGRAAYMIHPSERTPEQQARAQAYKDDILAPNAAARTKSQNEGTPMLSMQQRAAEYQKRKTGTDAAATSALETAATSASASGVASQSRSSLGSSIGGALGGLFGGSTGSTAGSLAGGLIEGVAGGGIDLQKMIDNMKNNLSQSSANPLQQNTNAAPNIPAQVASQSRTSNLLGAGQNNNSSGTGTGYGGGGGMGGGGPIQVNTTGTQEIIVRLPDIQAIVNQSITSLIYQTVGETFNNIASKVATNQNFEDLQRTFSEGVTETQTKQVNSSSTIGGK